MDNFVTIITGIAALIEIIGFTYIILTCRKVNRYIDYREDEAYQKTIYEKAKQDIRDINAQLTEDKP